MIALIAVAPLFLFIPLIFSDWIKELNEPIIYGPDKKD